MIVARADCNYLPPTFGKVNLAPELDKTIKISGEASYLCRSGIADYWEAAIEANTTRTYFYRAYFYTPEAFPSEAGGIVRLIDSTGTVFEISMGSTAQKNIRSFNAVASTAVGANSPEVSLNTWYVVEVKLKIAAAGNSSCTWLVRKANGEVFHPEQTAEQNFRNVGIKTARFGNVAPKAMTGLHVDEIGINDDQYSTDNTFLGAAVASVPSDPVATKCYRGASMDGDVGLLEGTGERADAPYGGTGITTWNLFEEHAGATTTLVGYSHANWSWDGFGAGASTSIINRTPSGEIPHITLTAPGTIAEINAGTKDALIEAWAQKAKEFEYPIFVRMFWEFNGNWWPEWASSAFTATEFVTAWQRIVNKVRAKSATNVTFVWCANVIANTAGIIDIGPWYPGDSFVDWIGMDGYVGTQPKKNEGWVTAFTRFKYTYDRLKQVANKPILISEIGASETGGDKPLWIREFFELLSKEFTKIKGVLWFNDYIEHEAERITWPIESSKNAQTAFKENFIRAYFQTKGAKDLTKLAIVPEPLSPITATEKWSHNFSRNTKGALLTIAAAIGDVWQSGFLRNAATRRLVVTESLTGAKWSPAGFLRNAAGALIIKDQATAENPVWKTGFLRDKNGALVTTKSESETPIAWRSGYLRNKKGALIIE